MKPNPTRRVEIYYQKEVNKKAFIYKSKAIFPSYFPQPLLKHSEKDLKMFSTDKFLVSARRSITLNVGRPQINTALRHWQ